MKQQLGSIDWKVVEAFFYRAMLAGWASGKRIERCPSTGTKTYVYSDGPCNLMLRDSWSITTGSECSSGSTLITVGTHDQAEPIWTMHYGGWYTKEAARVVKNALRDEYAHTPRGGFMGCRGPLYFKEKNLIYANVRSRDSKFTQFSGVEEVTRDQGVICGKHQYFGLAHLGLER